MTKRMEHELTFIHYYCIKFIFEIKKSWARKCACEGERQWQTGNKTTALYLF